MMGKILGRRTFVTGGIGAAATLFLAGAGRAVPGWGLALADDAVSAGGDPVKPQESDRGPFAARVAARAQKLASEAFEPPSLDVPSPFNALDEALYRAISFRSEKRLWRGEDRGFEMDLLPRGWIFEAPVEIAVVEGPLSKKLAADNSMFALGSEFEGAEAAAPYALSGFRLLTPVHQPMAMSDTAIFQGASYFRAIGRNQIFGTFARALAINTARAEGEEFPFFREFWIEQPPVGGEAITVHALFDSPSLTGAGQYVIRPGEQTDIDVTTTLFPRRDVSHYGFAPLTSMYYHGPASIRARNDVRPRVHNAEGLAIVNGRGERIWRPIVNHRTLQVSAFLDDSPLGFGLSQRPRRFDAYQDFDANFERRPSVWVTPRGKWGRGSVELVEIPTNNEIHDNVVAYWRPQAGLKAGTPVTYSYRISFTDTEPAAWMPLRTVETRVGRRPALKNGFAVAIDFDVEDTRALSGLPSADVSHYGGTLSAPIVRALPDGKINVGFDIEPGEAELIEVRVVLRFGDKPISESWVYRWTKP